MDLGLIATIIDIFQNIWYFISNGGWVLFVLLAVYILYQLYLNAIQDQYMSSVEFVFLEIKPPKENITSFYNAEQIFIQLHSLFDNWSFQEKYVEGKSVFKISFEIVSLGGKISYIIRIPKKQRDLIEATFYANYPSLEITEIDDYLKNFEYDPDDGRYEFFACEFGLTKPQAYPIRTYREFEGLHAPETSEVIVDPLSPLLESFITISQNEFYGLQFILEPVADGSWAKEVEAEVAKIMGDKDFMQLDEVIKQQVTALKGKLNRQGFKTKIRIMHLGTKESFNKNAKKLILSPFRIFSSINYNSFKPGFAPKKDYAISPTLEGPYIDYWVRQRKIDLFKGYKNRSNWVGLPKFILNAEELATLFHFPLTSTAGTTSVETMDVKRIQAPTNLPIGE